MSTVASVKKPESGHWYAQDGTPAYTVIAKSTGKPRPTTLADARKQNLLPSVTTILRVLHKQGLVDWLIEQAVLAAMTTPRLDGEETDAFIYRVLHTERHQDQEAQIARDRGTELHNALELYFSCQEIHIPGELKPWIIPAVEALKHYGATAATEKILVGDGYAGKTDLILDAPDCWWLWDYKTAKKLPDPEKGGAWSEHRLQLAAYAKAFESELLHPTAKPIRTANLYISTVEQGKFVICEHKEWGVTFEQGFAPLVQHWQWSTGYSPKPTSKPG